MLKSQKYQRAKAVTKSRAKGTAKAKLVLQIERRAKGITKRKRKAKVNAALHRARSVKGTAKRKVSSQRAQRAKENPKPSKARERKARKPGRKHKPNAGRKPKPKALVLFSGGLDSRLVVKILEQELGKQNVESVFFALPFGGGCCNDKFCVLRFAQSHAVRLHVIDCTKGRMFKKYMDVIRKPRFQRGTAMNPCIDCHLFMLKEAKRLAKKIGADIIATGEVLGERPLSQNMGAMARIEKAAGLEGKVLRPLSAKALPETDAEKNGLIRRSRMHGIVGRRRVKQIALAKKYGISFPTPGGGCLLTDKAFSRKLLNLLDYKEEPTMDELALLNVGRHFSYPASTSGSKQGKGKKSIIIVGRDEKENNELARLAERIEPKPALLEATKHAGPITLVISSTRPTPKALETAAQLTVHYSDAKRAAEVAIAQGSRKRAAKASTIPKGEIEKLRV